MKLIGNSNHSKHKTGCHAKAKKPHTALRALLLVAVIVGAIALGGYAWLKFGLSAPDVSDRQRGTSATEGTTPEPVEEHTAPPEDLPSQPAVPVNPDKEQPDPVEEEPAPTTASSGKKYTFAILGMDDGNGNSDTIMTATFDADNYTLNVVSIPRDTLVNVSWYTKKANTWYAMGGKEKGVLNGMRDLLGYQPDYYVIVDLDAFIKLIDGIGGVYYDVPQNMKYSDPYQDLYIDIKAGPQLLSGEDSMKVVRFRRYLEGDIKRISVQQDFLKTMMREVLENVSDIPITTLADIVLNDVETDMDYNTILWFAREMMKLSAENVTFQTLPGNYGDYVVQGGSEVSYVTIYVNKWLEMVNTYLNPFDEPITKGEVDILTRDGAGKLYATSGAKRGSADWGT